MHHLEKSDTRAVFEQVRADTASLTVGNKDLEDAASVYSYAPSVNFEMDEILMRHPAYKAAYGNVCFRSSELVCLADICSVALHSLTAHHKTRLEINTLVRRKRRHIYFPDRKMVVWTTQPPANQIQRSSQSRLHKTREHTGSRGEDVAQKSPPIRYHRPTPTRTSHLALLLLR